MNIRFTAIALAAAFVLSANAQIADNAVREDFEARTSQLTDKALLDVFSRTYGALCLYAVA